MRKRCLHHSRTNDFENERFDSNGIDTVIVMEILFIFFLVSFDNNSFENNRKDVNWMEDRIPRIPHSIIESTRQLLKNDP